MRLAPRLTRVVPVAAFVLFLGGGSACSTAPKGWRAATKTHPAAIPELGRRVTRGAGLPSDEQDKGRGTVIAGEGGRLLVSWDSGAERWYRHGAEGKVDLELLEGELPQYCRGQKDWGSVTKGTAVILRKHRTVGHDSAWAPERNQYLGRITTVTMLTDVDEDGCAVVRVELDNEVWPWRVRDLGLAERPASPTR